MPKKQKPTFEEQLARLQEIVTRLEEGPDTLEEMLALFEEGVAVARGLEEMLAAAETRIQKLCRETGEEEELIAEEEDEE